MLKLRNHFNTMQSFSYFACYLFNLTGDRWMTDIKSLAAEKYCKRNFSNVSFLLLKNLPFPHIFLSRNMPLKIDMGYLIQYWICNRWLIAILLFIVKPLPYNYVNIVVLTLHEHLKLICWFMPSPSNLIAKLLPELQSQIFYFFSIKLIKISTA